jgi:formate-dependent nitrite reductase membrane component NrfD/ferredoxin
MFRRSDGIVDFDKSSCIGCKACIAACPYDAIFINPDDHSAEKCNFCAHRLDVGLEPACVVVCPVEALMVGDLNDPSSRVAQIVNREPVAVRRPEKNTRPKVFYKGAHQTTLDPLAARRPSGGLYAWSTQPAGAHEVGAGSPGRTTSSAAALLAYDVSHKAPWDWRVSLYTMTKGIAAGVYLAALVLALSGTIAWTNALVLWVTPIVALVFLALTGAILISDLEHPERFYLILTRPQLRSWLARGAFIITAYGVLLVAHLAASATANVTLIRVVAFPAALLAVLTSIYTGYLFAQAKGRDLWQSPLLVPHLLAQSLMAGAAVLLPLAAWLAPPGVAVLAWLLAGASAVHLFFAAAEASIAHPTAHAGVALHEMYAGRYGAFAWTGVVLSVAALAAPWIGVWAAAAAIVALLSYEHAYVQAGQAVPLA